MKGILIAAMVLLSGCSAICNEPGERLKPGWPWHDVEHLGWLGLPQAVAPEPIAEVERVVEYAFCP